MNIVGSKGGKILQREREKGTKKTQRHLDHKYSTQHTLIHTRREFDWCKLRQEDLTAFGIAFNEEKGLEASARRAEEWYDRQGGGLATAHGGVAQMTTGRCQRDKSTEDGAGHSRGTGHR